MFSSRFAPLLAVGVCGILVGLVLGSALAPPVFGYSVPSWTASNQCLADGAPGWVGQMHFSQPPPHANLMAITMRLPIANPDLGNMTLTDDGSGAYTLAIPSGPDLEDCAGVSIDLALYQRTTRR